MVTKEIKDSGFVLLLKLLENSLNTIIFFKHAWNALNFRNSAKIPWKLLEFELTSAVFGITT